MGRVFQKVHNESQFNEDIEGIAYLLRFLRMSPMPIIHRGEVMEVLGNLPNSLSLPPEK